MAIHPLITRDPVSGGELLITRMECPESEIVIEGKFSLGWISRLTYEQLEFVRMLVQNRGNIQRLAAEMNVAYNTARNRMDDIVAALEETPAPPKPANATRLAILNRLAAGELSFDQAMQLLKDEHGSA